MGKRRDSRGWSLRRANDKQVWYVRFRPARGAPTIERSTGHYDRDLADIEAARIVAAERAGAVARTRKRRSGIAPALPLLVAEWLIALETTHAATTIKTWGDYARSHFLPFFGSTGNLTSESCRAYQRARLRQVEATTVRKEQSALRSLLGYCEEVGAVPPGVAVPALPKRATGTSHPQRRRRTAPPLTASQTLSIIRALPEWSTSRKVDRFPIRARFIVAYETGLRPTTLDRLQTPRHYRVGSAVLRLDKASVKERWARDVPLSRRARRVLDYLLEAMGPDYSGPVFGWHNYREHIAAAARAALPPDVAERFCAAHFRSAMLTHNLSRGMSLPAAQWLVGHTLVSTTARYIKPGFESAAEAVARRPRGGPPQSI